MNEQLPNAESRETPKTVLDYLCNKHSTIANDYRAPDGRYSEHCGLIAIDIAKLLLAAGRQPYIAKVSEDVREGSVIRSKTLTPTIENCNINSSNGCLLEIDTDDVTGLRYYTHSGTEPSIFRRQVEIIPDGDNKQATVNVTVKWRNKNTDSAFTLPIVLMNQSYVETTLTP